MTYAELSQLIQDYMESTETTMVGNVDNFIEFSEKKIYRSVDLSEGHKYQTATMTIGDEFVSLPSDCVVIRSVQVIDASTNDRTTLEQKDSTFMDEYILDRDSTGTPKYYSWYDADAILLAPSPDAADTVEIGYTFRPTQLSSSQTTTWLSTEAPDVLLNACLLEVAEFNRLEQADIQFYEKRYMESLQGLLMEENFRNRQDSERFRDIKIGA
jgi:hypothetical protein